MSELSFSPRKMLQEILQYTDYTLTQISEETGISRSTLSRIYHNCCGVIHSRNFSRLLKLYCKLIVKNSINK